MELVERAAAAQRPVEFGPPVTNPVEVELVMDLDDALAVGDVARPLSDRLP